MSDINSVTISGRVGQEPKVYHTEQGTIARFSVASTEHYRSGEEIKERVQWLNIAVYDKFKAEMVENSVHTGTRVLVQGAYETHSFDDKGTTRYVAEIAVRPGKSFLQVIGVAPNGDRASLKQAAGKRQSKSAQTEPAQ